MSTLLIVLLLVVVVIAAFFYVTKRREDKQKANHVYEGAVEEHPKSSTTPINTAGDTASNTTTTSTGTGARNNVTFRSDNKRSVRAKKFGDETYYFENGRWRKYDSFTDAAFLYLVFSANDYSVEQPPTSDQEHNVEPEAQSVGLSDNDAPDHSGESTGGFQQDTPTTEPRDSGILSGDLFGGKDSSSGGGSGLSSGSDGSAGGGSIGGDGGAGAGGGPGGI